jgi:purine-binding chemotaxis protein CheW
VSGQQLVQLAAFHVGPHEYAIDIMKVKEIINPLPITSIPRAPAFIEGVVELRGAIFPIVDLRKRFDLPAAPRSRATKYIVVAIAGRIIGLVVDAMSDLLRKPASEVRPPPALSPAAGAGAATFFSGVVHHNGKIIMVLDIDRVLSSEEKVSLAGMGQDA